MEHIELSGTKYPIRFDFRALKEFKALTGADVLKGFDAKDSDNILALTYTAIKSGYYFTNPKAQECPITQEDVSRVVGIGDMQKIIAAFMQEISGIVPKDSEGDSESPDKPGEIPGIV